MTIEAIAALEPGTAAAISAPRAATGAGGAFNSLLEGIEQLNGQLQAGDQAVQNIALGEADNLHQVMMTLERTRLEFELALQVRNKALEAYQELMRMQV
jgi:flagellar hook-basal body complex protein FliE